MANLFARTRRYADQTLGFRLHIRKETLTLESQEKSSRGTNVIVAFASLSVLCADILDGTNLGCRNDSPIAIILYTLLASTIPKRQFPGTTAITAHVDNNNQPTSILLQFETQHITCPFETPPRTPLFARSGCGMDK